MARQKKRTAKGGAKKSRTQKRSPSRLIRVPRTVHRLTPRRDYTPREDQSAIQRKELRRQLRETKYYADSLNLLRRYQKGFAARDGYNLGRLSKSQRARIKREAGFVRELLATPHVDIEPSTKSERNALQSHTRLGKRAGSFKIFPVQIQDPATNKIGFETKVSRRKVVVKVKQKYKRRGKIYTRLVPKKKTVTRRTSTLTIHRKYGGVDFKEQFFFTPKSIKTFKQLQAWMEKGVKKWPAGMYTFETATHGSIMRPISLSQLVSVLIARFAEYGTAEDFIIGVRWSGSDYQQALALEKPALSVREKMRATRHREAERARKELTRTVKRLSK